MKPVYLLVQARHAGSDGNMSAFGSAGLGFGPRGGSKFSTSGLGGVENIQLLILRLFIYGLD